MAISLKNPKEIALLAKAGAVVAQTLKLLEQKAQVGVSLLELDALAEENIYKMGGKPAFKGLYGFPNTLCTSVNEVVIHGIPTDYKLQEGDIVGLDLGASVEGYFGDAAITLAIGQVAQKDQKLIDCAKKSLYAAIDCLKVGMHFKEVSALLEQEIRGRGFVPLLDFCGHGIGKRPHEEPQIPNYLAPQASPKSGPKIKEGMVFCLEPMVCQKEGSPKILKDKWAVVSTDGLNTSHYEHTIAMVGKKAQILTEA
ncbi:type I methionyl aminopeptidase [Helicobacter heilmannii]|uniref:Methionine aminopeptidase n=1 Tax=Helicobacter heilmannii TaxID=35817 RepID=A0A0K2YBT1_HELHE|nr:type I methionyl aminopeptidase [Helicobacter heilmannii]BDQ26983.1 methionine aminopeptidase [Helicobacter heilmannii]CCM12420.1 Methionine aminopeptidase [Helicobacter heilmannii ASB1.4]CRI34435.1 Methionine aminopeptidase [Helicobacter heilmannii]